jgi:hypothetical protein
VYARARGVTWDDYQSKLESEFPTFRSVLTRDPGRGRRADRDQHVGARGAGGEGPVAVAARRARDARPRTRCGRPPPRCGDR